MKSKKPLSEAAVFQVIYIILGGFIGLCADKILHIDYGLFSFLGIAVAAGLWYWHFKVRE